MMFDDHEYDGPSWADKRADEQKMLDALAGWIKGASHWARGQHEQGDTQAAQELRPRLQPIFDKIHDLAVSLQMQATVPIPWVHVASDAEVAARISSPAMIAATDECSDGKRNVVLLGKTGVGKTTTLGLMARKYYRQQRRWDPYAARRYVFSSVHWVLARDLANAVLAHPLGKGPCEAVSRAQQAAVLVLDDLGLERDHGAVLDVLQERYQQGRVTWVTSGLTVEQISERYGEAVYRRLVEMNGTKGKVIAAFGSGAKPR